MDRQPLQLPDDEWCRRWLVTGEYDLLHRVSNISWNEDALIMGGPGETLCGLSGMLSVPGIFSRMGRPRCPECCRLAGVPEGDGAPWNESSKPEWRGR